MRGWFVDKDDGTPLAKVKDPSVKQDLIDAGHPFITQPIPQGRHDRAGGKFAKWDFVARTWVTDTVKENEFQQENNEKQQMRDDAVAAFEFLRDNQNTVTARDIAENCVIIFKHLKRAFR